MKVLSHTDNCLQSLECFWPKIQWTYFTNCLKFGFKYGISSHFVFNLMLARNNSDWVWVAHVFYSAVSVARPYISRQKCGCNLQFSNFFWKTVVEFMVKKWSFWTLEAITMYMRNNFQVLLENLVHPNMHVLTRLKIRGTYDQVSVWVRRKHLPHAYFLVLVGQVVPVAVVVIVAPHLAVTVAVKVLSAARGSLVARVAINLGDLKRKSCLLVESHKTHTLLDYYSALFANHLKQVKLKFVAGT